MYRFVTPFLFLALMTSSSQAGSRPMIETGRASESSTTTSFNVDRLTQSPVYQKHQELIHALARKEIATHPGLSDELRESLNQTLEELPFHRVIDVEISFLSGIPDVVGLCLEGFPTNHLAIEACASTAIFVTSLTLNMKYRWDLILKQTEKGRIHQLQFGPGVGIRHLEGLCFDACQNPSFRIDALASLEYTYWLSHKFGLQVQLDAGADFYVSTIDRGYSSTAAEGTTIPIAKIMFGFAF